MQSCFASSLFLLRTLKFDRSFQTPDRKFIAWQTSIHQILVLLQMLSIIQYGFNFFSRDLWEKMGKWYTVGFKLLSVLKGVFLPSNIVHSPSLMRFPLFSAYFWFLMLVEILSLNIWFSIFSHQCENGKSGLWIVFH